MTAAARTMTDIGSDTPRPPARPNSWAAFCKAMEESLDSEEARGQFEEIRAASPLVAMSADVHQLLGRIQQPVVEAGYRDLLYRELVCAAQRPGAAARLAKTILLLAMAGALGRVQRMMRSRSGTTILEGASDVILGFDLVIRRLDLEKVRAVAPTLVKNTARTLEYTRKKRSAVERREVPLPDDFDEGGYGSTAPVEPAIFGVRPASGVEDQINAVLEWAEPVIGKADALLVVYAVIEGETHAELAERLGISEANARVRLHRALGALRKHLGEGGAQ